MTIFTDARMSAYRQTMFKRQLKSVEFKLLPNEQVLDQSVIEVLYGKIPNMA